MKSAVRCVASLAIAIVSLTLLRADDLPPVPKVPDELRELMQDRKYDDAVEAIDKLLEDKPANADYLTYLKGRAQHLAGKHRDALATFARIERDFADSPWVRRAKFGQAAALLKSGDFEAAERIYEEEVRFLLSTERKHEIASIYLEFADAYFDPVGHAARVLAPQDDDGKRAARPTSDKKPDYAKALNFYKKALEVGPNPERRIEVEFRVARCHQELNQHAEAAAAYQAFLKAHPKSKSDIEARYQLGVVQLAQGQNVEARRTWKDLLDAHVDEKSDRLAEAAYHIAHTYGLPQAPSKEDLELAVAAAERFIAAYPEHKLAPKAALEIAQGYVVHNRHEEAIAALKKLLAEPKYAKAEVLPDARTLLGFAYQRQKKFAEAIAAWQDYLTKHPAHQAWAQVQQAIIDTEFLTALEARRAAVGQAFQPDLPGGKANDGQAGKADEGQAGKPDLRYAQARKLWEAFLAKYPLDGRAASIMLEIGLMNHEQEKYDAAIADWTNLVSKYPNTEESSRGQFLIGVTYEEKLVKFDEALAAYRKLTWGQFAPRAQERISRLTRQELTVVTERVFRTNQQPRVKVTTRNIKQLAVKAYRVDLETYFRKMHLASGIEGLDIALIDPDKGWTFDVPDYTDHKQIASEIEIPLDGPGVMAVTVANDPKPTETPPAGITVRPQEATTMVLTSDLDMLVKCSRNELFVFAENLRTGKPFPGVKLLVSDGSKVFAEGVTNDDGVFVGSVTEGDKTWEPLKASNDIRVFAVAGPAERDKGKTASFNRDPTGSASEATETPFDPNTLPVGSRLNEDDPQEISAHFASNVVGLKGVEFAQGIAAKGYIYTDRPTYRPGQLVHVRGVLRWVKGDEYFFEPGKMFKLDVFDSRGRQIRTEEVILSEFGSFGTRFVLPPEAAQGDYRLHVHDPAEPDKHNYQGAFAVHEYQLQPVQIVIDTPRKVYYRGEEVSGTIKLRYYYGSPVAEREIRYTLPDGTAHTAKTDAAGEVAFKFDTREFREDAVLTVAVQFPEMNLQAGSNLFLATRGFRAKVATARNVFIAGETFDVTVTTTDAAGKKTGEKMTLSVVERTEVQGRVGERTVEAHAVATDKETGEGRATIKVAKGGTYILRSSGTDRFGNPVSAEHTITVSGDDDTVRLRILADSHHFKAGDSAEVTVHWRNEPALALVTYQGARVLGYRLIELEKGTNKLEIPIAEKLAPNFELVVSVMADTGGETRRVGFAHHKGEDGEKVGEAHPTPLPSFHEASSPFEVERPLAVTIKPARDRVQPGDEVEVAITATDPQGKPVRAELSVAMIDKALLEIFPDPRSPIAQFFEGTRRTSALRSIASCTFRYAPTTRAISVTLIAEAERVAIAEMERAAREVERAAVPVIAAGAVPHEAPAGTESEFAPIFAMDPDSDDQVFSFFSGFFSDEQAEEGVNVQGFTLGLSRRRAGAMGGAGGGGFGGGGGQAREAARRVGRRAQQHAESNLSQTVQLLNEPAVADDNGIADAGVAFGRPTSRAAAAEQLRYKSHDVSAGDKWGYVQMDMPELRAYAQSMERSGEKLGKATQLGLLLKNGAVNVVDARKVAEGKFFRFLDFGTEPVVVLPEFQLRETGYWNPSVETDDDGQATLVITVPDRSTAWQLAARGITTGTLSGQATAELVAKKDLFGELKLPLAFVDGDSAQILATVHNDAVAKGKIEVTLKTTIAGKTREEKRTIDVTGKGTHELSFEREIAGTGEAVFELTVSGRPGAAAKSDEDSESENREDGNRQSAVGNRPQETAGDGAELPVAGSRSPVAESRKPVAESRLPITELDNPADAQAVAAEPLTDIARAVVPIRPYGIPVYATTGGTASSDMTAWVSPPAGMPVRDQALQIVIGPSVERSLMDVVLGSGGSFTEIYRDRILVCDSALERTTSDLMAALGLLKLLGDTRQKGSPEAAALADRVRSSVGFLVSSQNDDGGWSWSGISLPKGTASDRNASARALWALSLARKAGFAVPEDNFNKSITFVQTAFTAARENDYDGKAVLLHALSAAGRGDFAYANRLYRSRASLSPLALVHLALAFVDLDRKEIAREVLDVLAPKLVLAPIDPSLRPSPARGEGVSRGADRGNLLRQRPAGLDVQPMLMQVVMNREELEEPARAEDAVIHGLRHEADHPLPTERVGWATQLQKQDARPITGLCSQNRADRGVGHVTQVNSETSCHRDGEEGDIGTHVYEGVHESPTAIRRLDADRHDRAFDAATNERREPHRLESSHDHNIRREDVMVVDSLPRLSSRQDLIHHLIQIDTVCHDFAGLGVPRDPLAFVSVFDLRRNLQVHSSHPVRGRSSTSSIASSRPTANLTRDRGNEVASLGAMARSVLLTTAILPPAGTQERPASDRLPVGSAEVRALYLLALNAVAPGDAKVKQTADWLMAHRTGSRWRPERATGPAVLALGEYFAQARFAAAERYTLKIFVNDNEVATIEFDGSAGTRVVDVPKELLARGERLPEKDYPGDARRQRINFELVGRGRFTFNAVLSGFVAADQLKSTVNAYHIERYYEPAPLELDGREIPRGFDVLTGPFATWRNPVTELPVGARAQVRLYYYPINGHLIPEDQREYVVITEPIPSGCTVLEKSITGQFDRYEIGPGYITFYVGNRSQPNDIRFDLHGYTAGKYRSAPTIVRNFYDPERMMVTQPRSLALLAAGQKSKDEYKLTPRELYELGKRYAARAGITLSPASAGPTLTMPAPAAAPAPAPCDGPAPAASDEPAAARDLARAEAHLTELFDKFQLKPDIYKEVAQLLFNVNLQIGKAPAIVRYFEVLKEKYPELEVPFDHIVKVGAAYRELNEYERSYLVFRATAEASFSRESEVGGFLEAQGEFVRSVAVMDRILREYPAEPYVGSATFALAQRVYAAAPNAAGDPKLREKRITKVDLIRDAIHRMDDFLTVWPDDPAADQASFSIASALVELESWKDAVARSNRFAERYPKSQYLDSFWYIMGYSHFALRDHRDALDLCRRVAEAKRTDPATGREVESTNKWRAVYISGQVHHSLGEPAEAITEYERVGDRFPDAKEAIAYFTRKAIELPEVTTVKPGDDAEAELKFRNVAACELKVYRIDLLKFSLLQRDLANITKINLAGIRPLHEAKIELGDGKDYRDRTKKLELPLQDEGAYLVVCRGEDLHTSGLVLVTPLVVEVQEDAASGRVRATVKNVVADKYASEVHVKVIGSRNDRFKDGQTDLRGIFTTDGVQGRSTVIARAGDAQYAFHRGQLELGPPPAPAAKPAQAPAPQTAAPPQPAGTAGEQNELLRELFQGNRAIQQQKGKELKDLYEKKQKGVEAGDAF